MALDFKRETSLSLDTQKKNEIPFFPALICFMEPFIEPF